MTSAKRFGRMFSGVNAWQEKLQDGAPMGRLPPGADGFQNLSSAFNAFSFSSFFSQVSSPRRDVRRHAYAHGCSSAHWKDRSCCAEGMPMPQVAAPVAAPAPAAAPAAVEEVAEEAPKEECYKENQKEVSIYS